jgi:hypothetical protein
VALLEDEAMRQVAVQAGAGDVCMRLIADKQVPLAKRDPESQDESLSRSDPGLGFHRLLRCLFFSEDRPLS